MRSFLFSVSFLLLFSIHSLAQPGTLDQSFGNGGKVTSDFGGEEIGRCTLIQVDGKIIVAGSGGSITNKSDFFIARYKNDGTIDSTFGKKGKNDIDFRNQIDFAHAVTILPDQKILLAGVTSGDTYFLGANFALVKINANGSVDSTFGINGRVVTDFQNRKDWAYGISISGDGKIIVVGTTTNIDESESAFAIAQYNADGSSDLSFGNSGKLIIGFGNNKATASSVVIQPDNKILIAGSVANQTGESDFAFARVNDTGVLDSTFGLTGKIIIDFYQKNDYLNCITLDNDSKILAAGITFDDGNNNADFAIARLNVDGTLDLTFDNDGKVKTDYSSGYYNSITSMGLDSNGKIIVSGPINNYSSEFGFLLAAYNPNGTLDINFGTNGFTKTLFENAAAACYGQAIQIDGKIVVAGHALPNNEGGLNENIALARYNNDVVLPITLFSFTANKKQNSVLLNWQTASESNNSYFIIERSNNNSNFKELGKVNSKGNSTQVQQYSFEDLTPLNGANYYHLKQVNKDGSSTTSKTVLIDFSKFASIKLYPNPVKDIITIEGLTANKTTLSIIDINGKVLAVTYVTNTTYNWNIKALPAGNYYLRTEADKKINTIKFVKE